MLAPETGDYEFIVRTEHAARLWVNDTDRPLIDAWVKSGNDTEYRGVDPPARRPGVSAAAGVLQGQAGRGRLEEEASRRRRRRSPWSGSRRTGAAEVIPAAAPVAGPRRPRRSSSATPFPPDDRSVGYERGTSVSKAWDQATTDAAIEVAGYVAAHLRRAGRASQTTRPTATTTLPRVLPPVRRAGLPPAAHATSRSGCSSTASSRRPRDPETAVKRVVLLVLKSPRFLYREVGGGAGRLRRRLAALVRALGLAARPGAAARPRRPASSPPASRWPRQAERMLADPRARAKLREFFLQWLKVDQAATWPRTRSGSPASTQAIASDLRTSLDLFLDDVVWSEASDFRQLLLADDAVPQRPAGASSTAPTCRPTRRSRRSRSKPASGPAC